MKSLKQTIKETLILMTAGTITGIVFMLIVVL